jgi:hypothetical protein
VNREINGIQGVLQTVIYMLKYWLSHVWLFVVKKKDWRGIADLNYWWMRARCNCAASKAIKHRRRNGN